ncbi:Branched-chain amino acid ABC transporter, amino acid-binding protein [Labilithrix luteola]|uniref:Branched-chain amino acid ABC transporter, amino acid-binding protein n=1 Tax=Labilithrix luteola TaxID=1391654 RepID=A0A0K1Q582_9BACT|nr:Branched-chain amino acid ABC transporter, amino acid-binding protein [Labilithrix luteola]
MGLLLGGGIASFAAVACDGVFDVSRYHVVDDAVINGADAGGEGGAAPSCTVNADCVAEYSVCRKNKCVSLQSEDCARIVGDYKNDNAIVVGSLFPTAGDDQSTGLPMQNAIEVAIEDFRKAGNVVPVPGSSVRRPLVMVGCNDNSDDATAVRAARHLVDDVQVPAIIGACFSGITMKVATEVTIPGGTLLISPSATSVALTNLADNGLVWRTAPSDVIQADAHAAFFLQIEADWRKTIGANPINVAIAHKGDAYGSGLAQSLAAKLVMNSYPAIDNVNSTHLKVLDYGDPDDTTKPPTYAEAISQIITLKPHVIYLFGTTETITGMLTGIEAQWPSSAGYKPIYLAADGTLVSELAAAVGTKDELRRRIFGTIPGTNSANFKTFRILYNSFVKDGSSPDMGGTANSYDALYNVVFAAVAIGDKPLTGANLKDGFAKIVPPGPTLNVGSNQINTAFQMLLAGQSFDFVGASGPLDYDLATGEAPSDMLIWCLPSDGTKALPGITTEQYYDAAGKTMSGTLDLARKDCGM